MPPEPYLYSRLSTSLSMALVEQAKVSHAVSAMLASLRKAHHLKHCDPSVTEDMKQRLQASSPFAETLFDPTILQEVSAEFDGATTTAHHRSVSRARAEGSFSFSAKRKKGNSGAGSPAPAAQVASTQALEPAGVGSPLSDSQSGGRGYYTRGNRGKGRGGYRGKGGSRNQKTSGRGFRK